MNLRPGRPFSDVLCSLLVGMSGLIFGVRAIEINGYPETMAT